MNLKYPPLPASLADLAPKIFTFASGCGSAVAVSPRRTSFDHQPSARRSYAPETVIMKRKGSVGTFVAAGKKGYGGYLRALADQEEVVDYGVKEEGRGGVGKVVKVRPVEMAAGSRVHEDQQTARSPKEKTKETFSGFRAPTRPTQDSNQALNSEIINQVSQPARPFSIDCLVTETHPNRPSNFPSDLTCPQKYAFFIPKPFGSAETSQHTKDTVFGNSENPDPAPVTPEVLPVHPSPPSQRYSIIQYPPNTWRRPTLPAQQRPANRSRSRSRSNVIDRTMDRLAKLNHSEKVRSQSHQRTSQIKSKVGLLLSCPSFYRSYVQRRHQSQLPDTSGIRQSFVSAKSKQMLNNRPKMDIADLLLHQGRILEAKKEEMQRKSLPGFQPNLDGRSKSKTKSTLNNAKQVNVFERLAISTFVHEARDKSADLKTRKKSLAAPSKQPRRPDAAVLLSSLRKPTSFENLNQITLKNSGHEAFFIFEPKDAAAARPVRASCPGAPQSTPMQSPAPKTPGDVSPLRDGVYQKNLCWMMKREGALEQLRRESEGKDLVGCTFKPKINKRPAQAAQPSQHLANKENAQGGGRARFSLKSPDRYVEDILKSAGLFFRKGR